jgi:hypothetical protein
MSTRVEGKKFPNQGRQGLLGRKRKVSKGDNKNLCKYWEQKGFLQLPNDKE